MTMIALTLERQSQWLVFEPNTAALRAALSHSLSQFLGDLYRRGAFAGDTEAASRSSCAATTRSTRRSRRRWAG